MGDVNQDGYEDLLTLVHGRCGAPAGYDGFLWILSGRDGSRLLEVMAAPPSSCPQCYYYRGFCGAGDWDDDGAADFVVGLADNWLMNHRIEVRSGVSGSPLWWVPFSAPLAVLGNLDCDGDGYPDIVAADYTAPPLGSVSVFSHNGQLLYQLQGTVAVAPALSLGAIGDVDDDGADDFVMGCREPTGAGVNVVVSGRTGAYLQYCYGELPGDALFGSLARCGDLDGDGYDEFVAGSYVTSSPSRVCYRVFSARTGQALFGWTAPPMTSISNVASSGADLDGDSIADIVVGTTEVVSSQWRGFSYGFSGRDGSVLQRIPASQQAGGDSGQVVAALRVPESDWSGLVIVPSSTYPYDPLCDSMGTISAYRGLPRTAGLLGPACAGTLVASPHVGMQSLGATGVRVHLSDAPPSSPAVLLIGLSTTQFAGLPLPLSVDGLGFPGCFLRTSIDAQLLVVTGSFGQAAGYARIDLPHPVPVSGSGMWSLSAQWVVMGLGAQYPGGTSQVAAWRR